MVVGMSTRVGSVVAGFCVEAVVVSSGSGDDVTSVASDFGDPIVEAVSETEAVPQDAANSKLATSTVFEVRRVIIYSCRTFTSSPTA